MKFSFALLAALAAPLLAGAVSVPHESRAQSLNPHNVELHDPLAIEPQGDNLSNGERFRRGLNPKSPRHVHTPTRAQAARRAAASPVSRTGYFKIVKAEDDSNVGFVGKSFNGFGEYGLTNKVEEVLPISFSHASGDSDLFDISNHNPDQSSIYPNVGFTNGFASTSEDFSNGSFNYAYLTGVQAGKNAASDSNKPNSFTVATGVPKSSQSTVWSFDAASNTFSVEWSNADDASFPADLVYYGPNNVVAATGDYDKFADTFGRENVYKIKLLYVQLSN
ncbi:hypothetical protein BKA70DRAFT_1555360 [Coprinopsis sp. MPI-PUGE-AT-0042]|nr:hypothetical protein BKA70DRAFT_1555360 [Coprinopsis sp. MPI-PUGE-AT-0042]